MEMPIDSIIGLITMLLGGGSLGAFFTWRWQRMRVKAEAESASAAATQQVQDVYQQLITDIKSDRDEQKAYIQELKDDRRHLRADREDLRRRQDELEESVRGLQRDVARNNRLVEAMRPFLCGRENCAIRLPVTVSPDGEVREKKEKKKQKKEESNEEQ
jgi:hypothetical protein